MNITYPIIDVGCQTDNAISGEDSNPADEAVGAVGEAVADGVVVDAFVVVGEVVVVVVVVVDGAAGAAVAVAVVVSATDTAAFAQASFVEPWD